MHRRIPMLALALAAWASSAPEARSQVTDARSIVPTQAVVLDGQPLTPLARIGLERAWYTAIPTVRTARLQRLSLAGGMLFAQTTDANLFAYDAESGRALWASDLGERISQAFPVSVNARYVFVTAGGKVFALDRNTGQVAWSVKLESMPSTGTAANEDRVVIGLGTGKLSTFDTKNHYPGFAWQTNGALTGQPVLAESVIAFGSADSRAYVAVQEPPKLILRYLTGGPITATLGKHGTRTLIVPSADHSLYAIDLFTGETRWSQATGAPIDQSPLVAGDEIYVINNRGTLKLFDANTGELRWSLDTGGGRLLAVAETRVYLMTEFHDMFVVDRRSGRMVADARAVFEGAGLNLREYSIGLANDQTGRVYLGTPTGLVLCLREIGRTRPFLLRDPNERPFGHIPRRGEGSEDEPAPGAPIPAPPPSDNPFAIP